MPKVETYQEEDRHQNSLSLAKYYRDTPLTIAELERVVEDLKSRISDGPIHKHTPPNQFRQINHLLLVGAEDLLSCRRKEQERRNAES